MECNKLIKEILKNDNIECTENLFGIFCLFANGIMTFEDVLDAAKHDNIDFEDLCNKCNVNFDLVANRQ